MPKKTRRRAKARLEHGLPKPPGPPSSGFGVARRGLVGSLACHELELYGPSLETAPASPRDAPASPKPYLLAKRGEQSPYGVYKNPDDLPLSFFSFSNSDCWADYFSARSRKKAKMADPFEVRMRFSGQLQHLNASVMSAQKAAQYALKNKDMSEDLHSCILEQLEKNNSMNTRANIMYFIEHLLELACKENKSNVYVRMMQRDIIRVVDAVCPEDGSGAANVKVVRKVLQGLNTMGVLSDQTIVEINECLKDRNVSHGDFTLESPALKAATPSLNAEVNGATLGQSRNRNSTSATAAPPRLEKRQIEQRIEEDRERHKKRRENIWAVPRDPQVEMWKFFDDTSDLGEDDHILGREERAECRKVFNENLCSHMKSPRKEATNGHSAH